MYRNSVHVRREETMDEENRELEQIIEEMNQIKEMIKEVKNDTTYFKKFMENYNIPVLEKIKPQEEIKDFETGQKKQVKERELVEVSR